MCFWVLYNITVIKSEEELGITSSSVLTYKQKCHQHTSNIFVDRKNLKKKN